MARNKRQSRMTPFERWTLYLAAVGVLVSLLLQAPEFYDRFRSVRTLVAVPLDLALAYSPLGANYTLTMSFINNGSEDIVTRDF